RDGLLQRGCPRCERGRARDVDAFGQGAAQRARQRFGVDGLSHLDVEVLGDALVADRQREPEAHLGPRGAAERECERQLLDPKCPLEGPGDVAVRDESHLASLLEAESYRVSVCGLHELPPITTATPPSNSPWPVPWLPPAGGRTEATTCSSA